MTEQQLNPCPVQTAAEGLLGRIVLVRDHRAGVYCGGLESTNVREKSAILSNARQAYYWTGAAATPGIAARGVGEHSKIGPTVESVVLLDVVQLMPMTDEAWATIRDAKAWDPGFDD